MTREELIEDIKKQFRTLPLLPEMTSIGTELLK